MTQNSIKQQIDQAVARALHSIADDLDKSEHLTVCGGMQQQPSSNVSSVSAALRKTAEKLDEEEPMDGIEHLLTKYRNRNLNILRAKTKERLKSAEKKGRDKRVARFRKRIKEIDRILDKSHTKQVL